jgi:hypothetical protein
MIKHTEQVEGAPFQPGQKVTVLSATDDTCAEEFIGSSGTITALFERSGVGDSWPNDPLIDVEFWIDARAMTEYFWKEELQLVGVTV